MPKKNAPEFHFDEKKKLYRKRIKNEYTGAWVDVYGKTKQETRENVERRRQQFDIDAAARDCPFVYQYAATWYILNTQGLSESRKSDYRNAINNHICPVIGHMLMRDVKVDDVKAVLSRASGLSRSAQQKIVTALRRIFSSAEENGYIEKSPCKSIKPGGAPSAEKTALTDAQCNTLIEAVAGTRAYLFVMLGIYAGLRREEIAGLQWDCVHLDAATPYLEVRRAVRWDDRHLPEVSDTLKSQKSRRNIPLCSQLEGALKEAKSKASCDYVVPGTTGGPMTHASFDKLWAIVKTRSVGDGKKLGDKIRNHQIYVTIDFPVTPHTLRHTFITNLILSGANIKTVQYLAGHATVQMTLNIYTHLIDNQPQETLAAVSAAYDFKG